MQVDFDGTIHEFPDDFTDEEISQALGTAAPPSFFDAPSFGPLKSAVGGMEGIGSMLTGAVGQAVGGIEALGRMPFQGMDKSVEEMRKTQEALTYNPRTQAGQKFNEVVGNAFGSVIEGGAQLGEKIAPAGYESEGRLAGGVGTEVLANFLPIGAAAKGIKGLRKGITERGTPEAITNLDRIAEAKKGEPTPETALDTLEYKQQDLPLEPPVVDASGIKNPYDVGGQISDTAAGLDTMLDSPQGDLFAKGLKENAQNKPEIIAAKEAFQNEALDLEARMRAALFIVDNHKMYDRKTVRAAKDTAIELQKAHEANRDAYAIGNDLLDQEKPRDALGRPLYDQPEPLVQPAGVVEGAPIKVEGPDLTTVPTEGVIGKDPAFKPFVPKSQRGAWTPWADGKIKSLKEIVGNKPYEMVSEVERTAKVLRDEVDTRENHFKAIGAEGVDMISADKPVTPELIDKILAEPDVGSGKNFISGALAKAELNNSTGALSAYRWFANATKRAERFDRDYVRPVAAAARSFLSKPEEVKVLRHLFQKELETGTKFTDAELAQAGLDPKVLNTYVGMRRMFDASLEAQNKARAEAGLSKISALEAYEASRWNGPWRASVLDKDGNIVWQVAEKNRLAAMNAVKWLQKNVDEGLKIGDIKYNESYGRDSPDLHAGYVEMVNLLGTDHPITARIKELIESQAAFTTENVLGQEKHFKRKAGVRGFAGDRPWAKSDPKDWFLEQLTYAKNSATWAEQQTALRNVKELLADPRIVKDKENLAAYVKQYSDFQRGVGTKKVFDVAENSIAKAMGISPAHLDTVLGSAKSIFYITKLGMMNLPFTAAQLIQPVFTAPYHSSLSKAGFKHNMAKSSIEGLSNAANFTKVHLMRLGGMHEMADKALHKMHPLFRDAALYAEQNGVIDVNQFSDIRDLNRPQALKVAEQVAGFNIKASEQLARSTAFFTFVSHLDQSGKFPNTKEGRMALYQKAEEATRFTMVDYSPSERALAFGKMGLTGNALSTLQTFKLNQINQMVKYIDELRDGNPVPALQFFGLYYLLGGLTGFVGVEDADALYEGFKSILSDEQFAALPKAMREFGVKKKIMEMDELVSMGPVSKLTGANLYTRFDSSNIIPIEGDMGESLGNLFPFVKDLYTQAGGAKDLASGDPNTRLAGGYAMMPSSLKGPYENLAPGFTTPEGVVGRSTNPAEGDYRRTESEQDLRNFGFRSTKEAKTRELDFRDRKLQKDLQTRRSNISKKVSNQILFGKAEDLNDSIEAYTRLGGDPNDLVTDAGLQQKFFNKNTNRLEKLFAAAQNGKLPALYDLLRYMESQGVQPNN